MRTLYVVCGETGEYSDHRCWNVRSFSDRAKAEELRDRLNAWCKERGLDKEREDYMEGKKHGTPPDDESFRCDYTGTIYDVLEIPFDTQS